MFMMLSAFSQFERALIRERQKEGIALAKTKGVYKGRKPILNPEQVKRLKEAVANGGVKAQIARGSTSGAKRFTTI